MYIDFSKVINGLRIDCPSVRKQKVDFLKAYFDHFGFSKAIIGLSGGIDSAVSAELACAALGASNVLAYSLPYSDELHNESKSIAAEIAFSLGMKLDTISIRPIVDSFMDIMGGSDLCKGNACARARMMALMHMATEEKALVLGTENKTEELLAYYTIGGDNVSNIEPIHDLYKVQIFQLAEYLGLPKSVIDRAPSAELWAGQTDELEIGAKYEDIDNILFLLENKCEKFLDKSQITSTIINRYNKAKGKRLSPCKIKQSFYELE